MTDNDQLGIELDQIDKFIERVRESFDKAEEVYTCGSCYKFALILEAAFPGGDILTNESHAIYEYRPGYCFDITGRVRREGHLSMKKHCSYNRIYERLNLKYEE